TGNAQGLLEGRRFEFNAGSILLDFPAELGSEGLEQAQIRLEGGVTAELDGYGRIETEIIEYDGRIGQISINQTVLIELSGEFVGFDENGSGINSVSDPGSHVENEYKARITGSGLIALLNQETGIEY